MAIITDGARTKFTDDVGLPLIGGQVFSYQVGTSTPKDTYIDREFTIPNTNPIILDDVGSCQMYLKGGYRLRVLDVNGVLIEEKDNAFQSDGQVLDVVANTTAIAALKLNVDTLNTRGGLKLDANNHIIGQGKAESATVYDLSLRADKVRVSSPTAPEFGSLIFTSYDTPQTLNNVVVPAGEYLNPALFMPNLAAGKATGSSNGQVPLAEQTLQASSNTKPTFINTGSGFNLNDCVVGVPYLVDKQAGSNIVNAPPDDGVYFIETKRTGFDGKGRLQTATGNGFFIRSGGLTTYGPWFRTGGANGNNSGLGSKGDVGQYSESSNVALINTLLRTGSQFFRTYDSPNLLTFNYAASIFSQTADTFMGISADHNTSGIRVFSGMAGNIIIRDLKHTGNTTIDANGFLKNASPVVDLYNDKIDLNEDAQKQPITFEKVSVGNYLIKGSLGFSQDGWYIEMPKDANGNVLVAVAYEQLANNDISIKTYAKRFDDETGDIVANLLKPRDIPTGRFISLRLHELPVEPSVMPVETTTP